MIYIASEIDKYTIFVTQNNHPNTIQVGDVNKFHPSDIHDVTLLSCGSPCQDLSFAGKGKGLIKGERSNLFFEFIRIRDIVTPKYVLVENVRMKKEYQNIMSKHIGFEPQVINSSVCTPQNRYRLYWFGERCGDTYKQIPIPPMQDLNLVLQDILEEDGIANPLMTNKEGKSHCLTARYNGAVWWNSIQRKQRTMVQVGETDNIKGFDIIKRIYSPMGKSPTLTTMQGGHREPKVAIGRIVNRRLDANGVRKDNQLELPFTKQLEIKEDGKTNCLTTFTKDNVLVKGMEWRKLTPLECERLQGLPDNYTEGVSNSQRYKMIGNGFTIPVIKHILKDIVFKDMTTISLFDGYSGCQQAIKELLEENKNESK